MRWHTSLPSWTVQTSARGSATQRRGQPHRRSAKLLLGTRLVGTELVRLARHATLLLDEVVPGRRPRELVLDRRRTGRSETEPVREELAVLSKASVHGESAKSEATLCVGLYNLGLVFVDEVVPCGRPWKLVLKFRGVGDPEPVREELAVLSKAGVRSPRAQSI